MEIAIGLVVVVFVYMIIQRVRFYRARKKLLKARNHMVEQGTKLGLKFKELAEKAKNMHDENTLK
jgi:predicted signal transduction protein with EAL and GGDEF domain